MQRLFVGTALAFALLGWSARAVDGPVSRLPPLPTPYDPIIQKAVETRKAAGGDLINLQLTTGHAPKIMAATNVLASALRFDAKTPRILRELAILRTAEIVKADYEIAQHRPFLLACGYDAQKVDAVQDWRASKLFDDKERTLLAYVDQVAGGGDVDDPTFAKFSSAFDPQEMVELTVTIGNYVGNGLLTKAFRIQIENDGRHTMPGKC